MVFRGKAHSDQCETIIGHPTERPTIEARVKLEALHLHTAPVGEIRSFQRLFRVVLGSLYGASDSRMHPVGSNHDARFFSYDRSALLPTADSTNTVVLEKEFINGKIGSQLGPACNRSLHQNGIEDFATRGVCFLNTIGRWG